VSSQQYQLASRANPTHVSSQVSQYHDKSDQYATPNSRKRVDGLSPLTSSIKKSYTIPQRRLLEAAADINTSQYDYCVMDSETNFRANVACDGEMHSQKCRHKYEADMEICHNVSISREKSSPPPLKTKIFRRSISPQSYKPTKQNMDRQQSFLEFGRELKERWDRQGAKPKAR
jgi:hypothetical protein